MGSKLSEWRSKIEELEAKTHLTREDEPEIDQQLDSLKDRYQELEDYLGQLKTHGKQQNHDFEGDVGRRWSNLIQELEKMAAKFQ